MEVVTKIAPIALALIMLGLGMGLTTKDFLRVLNNPRDFVIGFICQLIIPYNCICFNFFITKYTN